MTVFKSHAFKILVAVALFGLISLKVDIGEAVRRLLALPPQYIMGAAAGSFFALLVQAWKTKILLRAASVLDLFRVSVISQFYAMVFFGQVGGDVAKAAYLLRADDTPHKVVAAVLFDRITGLAALVLLGLLGMAGRVPFGNEHIAFGLATVLGGLLACMGGLLFLDRLASLRLLNLLPDRPKAHLLQTVEALRALSADGRTLAASVFAGLLFQGVIIVNCAWLASGLRIELSLEAWAVVHCVMSLVLLLPVSIAGIGLRDVTLVGILGAVGIGPELALALSFALLGLQLIMAAAGGLLTALPAQSSRRP